MDPILAANTTYYKFTSADENHNGFQYQDGLNILEEGFDENDPKDHRGLYFAETKNVFDFLSFGINLREVTLPINEPGFKMTRVNDCYRANMLVLGTKYELNLDTIKMLVGRGADIRTKDDNVLRWAAFYGYLDIVKYLVDNGCDIHANDDQAIHFACEYGYLDLVKYLMEKGADIYALGMKCFPLLLSAENGHMDVFDYLNEWLVKNRENVQKRLFGK